MANVLSHDRIPISGREGVITAVFPNAAGADRVKVVAEIKTITANIEFNKIEYRVMGDGATRHKSAGWTGTGSLTYHWLSPLFVKMIVEGARTGALPYFTINVTNDDPVSAANGKQVVSLSKVLIDGGDIAVIDVDSDMLEGSIDFTFSEVAGIEYFREV